VRLVLSASAELAPPLVTQLAVVLVGAALVGYVCQRVGLIPIVGYVATGSCSGPARSASCAVVIGSPERVRRLRQVVAEALPGVEVVSSDVSGAGGRAGPRHDPTVRLIVVDSSAGPPVATRQPGIGQ
jgi:hypothetical protein